MTDTASRFAHQRLDAYRVGLELFRSVEETPSRLAALRRLCDRVAAMLTGLMRREQARAAPSA